MEKLHLQFDWRNEEKIEEKINEIVELIENLPKDFPLSSRKGNHKEK